MNFGGISRRLSRAFDAYRQLVAIEDPASGTALTYEALEARSAAAASALGELGISSGHVVALEAERTLETLVCLVGILRSGAAVLPIRVDEPPDRRDLVLQDAKVSLVVTASGTDGHPTASPRRLTPESLLSSAGADPCISTIDVLADAAAYVLFTSGSTGRPKGVAMPHRALDGLIEWHLQNDSRAPGRRTAQVTPLTFDVSFQEILSSLCSGGTLVLLPEGARRDPRELLDAATASRIDRLFLPTALLQVVAEEGTTRLRQPPLRDVIVAGSALRLSPGIRQWFSGLTAASLHNHYGPTETHVVTAHILAGDPATWPEVPPIGVPLPHAKLTIVDTSGHPLAPGRHGQLVVGGACVGLGYVAQPAASEEQFRAGPDGLAEYWTGDICSFRDGLFWYHGREDRQVKVRGHRVELAEVEASILALTAISDCAVAAVGGDSSAEKLIAYVVDTETDLGVDGFAWIDSTDYRAALRQRLPDYMVPHVWVALAALPLTNNGKVDVAALPDLGTLTEETSPGAAPSTDPLERTVCDVASAVLGMPCVGVDDDLLALGATSLEVTRIAARLATETGRVVAVTDVLRGGTPSRIAARLRDLPRGQSPRSEESDRSGPTLSQVQQSFRVTELLAPGNEMNIAVSAHFFDASPQVSTLESALADLLSRHGLLSTGFDLQSGTAVPLSSTRAVLEQTAAPVDHPENLQRVLADLVATERATPFDLASGPFRARLVELAPFGALLMLTFHHIAFDGWSEIVFLEDLALAYEARQSGDNPPWPGVPADYQDHIADESEWLRSAAGVSEREWWVDRLAGVEDLPITATGPTTASRPATVDVGRRTSASVPDVAYGLSALAEGLRNGLGLRGTIAIGLIVSGRSAGRFERTVGPFLNTVCVPITLTAEPVTPESIADPLLASLDHARLPFGQVVTAVRRRPQGMHPLCQTLLVSQDYGAACLRLGGMTGVRIDIDQHPHPFHLVAQTWREPTGAVLRLDATESVPASVLGEIGRSSQDVGKSSEPGRP